jgi:hypothetical protein
MPVCCRLGKLAVVLAILSPHAGPAAAAEPEAVRAAVGILKLLEAFATLAPDRPARVTPSADPSIAAGCGAGDQRRGEHHGSPAGPARQSVGARGGPRCVAH